MHPHGGFGRRRLSVVFSSPFPARTPIAGRFPFRLIQRRSPGMTDAIRQYSAHHHCTGIRRNGGHFYRSTVIATDDPTR